MFTVFHNTIKVSNGEVVDSRWGDHGSIQSAIDLAIAIITGSKGPVASNIGQLTDQVEIIDGMGNVLFSKTVI